MSLSTLDRWIASGQVQIGKEPHGQRHRVYVVLEDGGPIDARLPDANARGGEEAMPEGPVPDRVSLAIAEERVRGLEEMVEQLKVEREPYTGLVNDLWERRLVATVTGRLRRWWRF